MDILFLFLALFFLLFGTLVGLIPESRRRDKFIKLLLFFLLILIMCLVLVLISTNTIQSKVHVGMFFVVLCLFGSFLITVGLKGGIIREEKQKWVPKDTNDIGS